MYKRQNLIILDAAKVEIGDNVFIAPDCGIYTAGHPLDVGDRNKGLEYAFPVKIGNNVWIGRKCFIFKGARLGDGCIISSGTYTGKEIPPHSLVAGNPGRIVRRDVVWAVKDKPELKSLFPLSADDEDGMRAFYERAYEVTPTIKHRKGCRLLNRLRVFWALFSAK